MANAGRWVFCPATTQKIGYKATLADRFRRWQIEREKKRDRPDLFMVTGYNLPICYRK